MDTKNSICRNTDDTKVPACRSGIVCSPCILIWGALLIVIFVQYLLR